MKNCATCGMPLEKKEDFALGDENAEFCVYCTNVDGSVKSGEEIFKGGVEFFRGTFGSDQIMAEKITRKNMRQLPYWREHNCPCLEGEIASDEEFQKIMAKL